MLKGKLERILAKSIEEKLSLKKYDSKLDNDLVASAVRSIPHLLEPHVRCACAERTLTKRTCGALLNSAP